MSWFECVQKTVKRELMEDILNGVFFWRKKKAMGKMREKLENSCKMGVGITVTLNFIIEYSNTNI